MYIEEIEDDDVTYNSGRASDTFFIKIIVNALKYWRNSYQYDNLMKILIDRFPGEVSSLCVWPTTLRERVERWQEENMATSYVPYSKIFSNDDIKTLVIDEINSVFPEIEKKFVLTETAKTLSTLLDCDENETLLLQLALHNRYLPYPIDAILPRISQAFDNQIETFSAIFGITRNAAKNMLDSFIIKSGFIVPTQYPEGFFSVAPIFEDTFSNKNIKISEVEDLLFPDNLQSSLELSDYKHIESHVNRTSKIINHSLNESSVGTNIMLWGPAGTGKTELAITLAKANGWNLRSVGDISQANMDEKSRADRLSNLKIAMKLFANDTKTVLLFDEIEDLFKVDNNASFSKAFINRIIETTPVPIIWTTNNLIKLGEPVLRRMTYNIHCDTPSKTARRTIWNKYADQYGVNLDTKTVKMLDDYDLSPALIHNAMKITSIALTDNKSDQGEIKEIISSLDKLVNFGFERSIEKHNYDEKHYDVECANTEHPLNEFTDRLVNAKAHNFALCLYGPPGTGKSQYARYLAKQMDKDVVFKRASDLISMWVGQTEKNIAKAFAEAKNEQAVLIIDEGDTFLQDRSSAGHSWEISQVNEILSQMEEHPEPFVITTNLMSNLDPASMRRFTFKMKFDYLKPYQSQRLFKRYFNVDAPESILTNHILTPGDIACVLKQVNILGLTDPKMIYDMILKECELKPDYSKPMGF